MICGCRRRRWIGSDIRRTGCVRFGGGFAAPTSGTQDDQQRGCAKQFHAENLVFVLGICDCVDESCPAARVWQLKTAPPRVRLKPVYLKACR
jgi:hypothetical protein